MTPVFGSPYPPGTIILVTSGPPRFADFWACFARLKVPDGTIFSWERRYDAAGGREMALRRRQGDWVWFLDDDHTFEPDALLRLLSRGLPALGPIAARRRPPHPPIVMRESGVPYDWPELHPPGVMELEPNSVLGMGGFLAWECVFEALEPPYFRVGQFNPAHMQEDVYFCRSIWKAGIPIHLDRDVAIGHTDAFTIVPKRYDGGWEIDMVPGYLEERHGNDPSS